MVLVGGEVTIECVTDNVISRPEYVLWTFNGKVGSLGIFQDLLDLYCQRD